MIRLRNFLFAHWQLIAIVLIGIFLRTYKFEQLFYYGHDHDLEGWFIRDVLQNHHLRLIGQETSQHGVFIGAGWYYLLIPFYILSNMDPIGGIWLSLTVAICSIISLYFVFSKIWNKQVGLAGAAIYSFSFSILFTDREVVPTTPVYLWSIWFLYAVYLIKQGNQKLGFILSAILIALIWHINLSLVLLTPLILISFILSKKRLNIKSLFAAVTLLSILMLPFFLFEVRHNFSQTQAVFTSVTGSDQITKPVFADKLDRTMQLVYTNTSALFFGRQIFPNYKISYWLLVIGGLILIYKKIIQKGWPFIFAYWLTIFVIFFSLNSINLSEYYLNGMNVVWIAIASLGFALVYNTKKIKWLAIAIGFVFVLANAYRFSSININQSGYIQRKQIINYIKQDSIDHNFPCVSLSFITTPGNNFGYRYFTWEAGLKTKPVSSDVPVYSIVFPLTLVDGFDKSFGSLGLVLPDYSRYNEGQIQASCRGDDYNLVYPLFGFTN